MPRFGGMGRGFAAGGDVMALQFERIAAQNRAAIEKANRYISRRGEYARPKPVQIAAGGTTGGTTGEGSEALKLYKEAIDRLSGGGAGLEASLADIEEGKQAAIARGQQSMVSGGLAGTTVMGGVPVAAEKTASRARLAARGEAESKYLSALTQYTSFAQQAQQAAAERQAAMQRLQMQLAAQSTTTSWSPASFGGGGGGGYAAPVRESTPPVPRTMVAGMGPTTAYSQQFPSIYGQGEAEEPVPDWSGGQYAGMSGAGGYEGLTPPKTGIAGMTTQELETFRAQYS